MSEAEIVAENHLVEEAKRDINRFNVIYDRYFEVLFAFIYRRTDDEQLTDDLVSQTFLKAMQNLNKYEFRGLPISAWLFRIATNELNKHFNKYKKERIFSLEEEMVRDIISSENEDENDEKVAILIKILKEIPTDMMEVLELRFFEGKGFKEISYILDITESGAKMRTYRALDKL
ncbi:MAG: sigma-70 family RNA polymerase sigma factor, partial [Cyclobacteriaceae bacterium]|nr:sigma-70 family RNA polymerase sigma factor [Cyclobacteriaceae bacterium]